LTGEAQKVEYISVEAIKKCRMPLASAEASAEDLARLDGWNTAITMITEMLPSVSDVPKEGEWKIDPDGYYPYCSECRAEPAGGCRTNYCSYCGAKMKEAKRWRGAQTS
jgi:hypothetical protein